MPDVFTPETKEGENESLVEKLVGEDKKFKTTEDLAKGKLEADTFIEQLKEEVKIAREKLGELEEGKNKDDKIAELLEEVRKSQKQGQEGGDTKLSEEDLSKKIKEIMQGESAAATARKNRDLVNQAVLAKVDGNVEAARTYVSERAKQLGMTPEGLAELGEKSPEAFIKLIDGDPSTVKQGVVTLPDQSRHGQDGSTVYEIDGHKTKAYYDKLKKDMGPAKYWNDVKVQGAYAKDAMALAERFNQ